MAEKGAFTHFSHRACEYYPCHPGANPEGFNCLFCYCPLYALGRDCGGGFTYTAAGVKDCSRCRLPHEPGGWEYVMAKLPELIAKTAENGKN